MFRYIPIALAVLLQACASNESGHISQNDVGGKGNEAKQVYGARLPVASTPRPDSSGDLDKPVVALYTPSPEISKETRSAGISGVVGVRFLIGVDGTVSDVRSIRPAPAALVEVTVKAVSKWRFEPPLVAGKPSPVYVFQEFGFKAK